MSLKVTTVERIFRYNGQDLADPNPTLDADTVMRTYAAQFPELATASVEGPKTEDGKQVYTFQTRIGTKG